MASNTLKTCFIKYADFSGRASRSEFWEFYLWMVISSVFAIIVDKVIFNDFRGPFYFSIKALFFMPNISVTVRRLHDINISGWWFTGSIIIILGIFIFFRLDMAEVRLILLFTFLICIPFLYLMMKKGNEYYNKFGENPLTKASEKSKMKRSSIVVLLIASFLIMFTIATEIPEKLGFIPENRVQPGNTLPKRIEKKLVENEIIISTDRIIYFYADDYPFITSSGQILTEDYLIVYEEVDNDLEKAYIPYKHIKSIKLTKKGNRFCADSVYEIICDEDYKVTIMLSPESDGDKKFINELKKRSSITGVRH